MKRDKNDVMKAKYSLSVIAGLLLCFYGCKKNLDGVNPASIVGHWSIVTDSTFAGAGLSNHPVDYIGRAGDYFDINANGNIYTKEGVVLDTLSYSNVSDTTIIISPFGITLNGVPETSHIIAFTAHSLVIDAPKILTPGGVFGRKISLSR